MLTLRNDDKCQEIFSTTDEPAIEEAAKTMRALRGLANDLDPRATLVLAGQTYPGVPLVVAARKLTLEFSAMRAEAKAIAVKAEKAKKAESERLSPWTIAVINRGYEVKRRIDGINKGLEAIARRNGSPDGKAGELHRQGVSMAEIERLQGKQKTTEELTADRAVLKAEHEKLELFLKTGDVSVLPADLKPYKRVEIGTVTGKTISGNPQRAV